VPEQQSRPGMRDVLAQPQFRRLWTARTVSQWGDVFSFVALAILIYRLTASGLGAPAWWSPRSCPSC
jgi:hypothetical protein